MKVRMLVDRPGAPYDGIHVQVFKAGEVYDFPVSFAEAWLKQGHCEQDKMGKGPDEVKDETQSQDGAGGQAGKARRRKK